MAHKTTFNISRRTLLAGMAGTIALAGAACGATAGSGHQDSRWEHGA